LSSRSPLCQFVTVTRDFGFAVAMRVAYSKLRGRLSPGLALPEAPVYEIGRREVSVLLGTAEQEAATLNAVVEVLAERADWDWEICICERSPAPPEMARALARLRGTRPWIRIVTTDQFVDDATAVRWTVEQATGQYVALVAPGYAPAVEAIARLVHRLRIDAGIDAAALLAAAAGLGGPALPVSPRDCRLLLQTKSGYLAALPGRRRLSAPALAGELEEAGVPIAYLAEVPR
jgi:hypothetical protein